MIKNNPKMSPEIFNEKTSVLFSDIRKIFIQQFSNLQFQIKQIQLPSFSFKTSATGAIYFENYSHLPHKIQDKLRFNYIKTIEQSLKSFYDIKIKTWPDVGSEAIMYVLPKSQKDFFILTRKANLVFLKLTVYPNPISTKQNEFIIFIQFGSHLSQMDTEHALRFFDLYDITESWDTVVKLTAELKKIINIVTKSIRLTSFN